MEIFADGGDLLHVVFGEVEIAAGSGGVEDFVEALEDGCIAGAQLIEHKHDFVAGRRLAPGSRDGTIGVDELGVE